jgi:hypothetical protein
VAWCSLHIGEHLRGKKGRSEGHGSVRAISTLGRRGRPTGEKGHDSWGERGVGSCAERSPGEGVVLSLAPCLPGEAERTAAAANRCGGAVSGSARLEERAPKDVSHGRRGGSGQRAFGGVELSRNARPGIAARRRADGASGQRWRVDWGKKRRGRC